MFWTWLNIFTENFRVIVSLFGIKIGINYEKFWNFSKNGQGHIKTKINQLVLVSQGSDNITLFKPISNNHVLLYTLIRSMTLIFQYVEILPPVQLVWKYRRCFEIGYFQNDGGNLMYSLKHSYCWVEEDFIFYLDIMTKSFKKDKICWKWPFLKILSISAYFGLFWRI